MPRVLGGLARQRGLGGQDREVIHSSMIVKCGLSKSYTEAYHKSLSSLMDEFEIPITYQGINREFFAKVLHLGYTYKIQVEVDGILVLFEPDESRLFRAVLVDVESEVKSVDKKLIETIAQTLDALLGAN